MLVGLFLRLAFKRKSTNFGPRSSRIRLQKVLLKPVFPNNLLRWILRDHSGKSVPGNPVFMPFVSLSTALFSGLWLATLLMTISVNTATALTCLLCNALKIDKDECWSPSSPPKKVTECGTGVCRSHLVYLGPDSHSNGQSIPLSILRECADFSDKGRSEFLRRMKDSKNATSGSKVYCVTDRVPCSRDCYCAEDLCNNWTNDKVAQADQRSYNDDNERKLNVVDCNPSFNATSSETDEAKTSSVGTGVCPFLGTVCGVIIAIQRVFPIHVT